MFLLDLLGRSFFFLGVSLGPRAEASSAISEIFFQAVRLSTLNALPVPMLRQVYFQGLYGFENGVFAREVLQKWLLGFILGSAWTSWGH